MLETKEIFHTIITEDTYTVGTRCCCQHCDEPLRYSRDSPNKEYDQSEDRKSSMTSNSGIRRPEFGNVWSENLRQSYRIPLNYTGFRQRSRDSHIKGLQISETLHYAGSCESDKSHSYRSEALPRSQTVNSAGQHPSGNSHSYMTEGLYRSKTLLGESLNRSQTLHSEGLHTSDELYSHSLNDSTNPPFEGTQGVNLVLQNALQAIILRISMLLGLAGKYRHVVILMVFITSAACTDVQVHINCTSAAVITSPNYPATYPQYETIDWHINAPERRMILLIFHNFSLASRDNVEVIDTVDDRNMQHSGIEDNTLTPFISRRNSLLLRFRSYGNPIGIGFNLSASCFDLSGTRVGRLAGGNTPTEGFLELQAESGGEWMRVCGNKSANRVAEVVCWELGFPGVHVVSYEEGGCPSNGADCIRAPSCDNYTYRSQDCSASPEECTSSLAVKVKCFEPGYKGCYDLGNTQLKNGSSYDSTTQCVTSCRGDTSKAIAITNGSKCFCSTTDDIRLSSFSKMKTRSCATHHLVYNATVGFCNQTDDIMNGSWDSDVTWFGSIVHLTCDDGYRLNGSGILQCVTAISTHIHVWNGSIPTCNIKPDSTSRSFTETTPTQDTSPSGNDGRNNAVIPISSSMTALIFVIVCAVVWKCRGRKINKKRAAPSITAIGESDQTNATRALPQPPDEESLPNILLNRSQHVTRMPHNSSTLHPSFELTAFQHGNNNYTPSNPYHYAISMTHPPQVTPNMGNPVNAYELGESIDRNANGSEDRTEMMSMFNRPLPHRPISVGVREGPSLPPRERHVIHSSTLSPNLRQNARSLNSHLGACSLAYNPQTNGEKGETVGRMPRNCAVTKEVVVIYPFKGTTSNENAHHGYYSADDLEHEDVHNGGNFPMSPSKLYPFYHCLGDDDQQMCSNDCDTDVLINNGSNAPDDYLVEVMVDNVLYNPMDF